MKRRAGRRGVPVDARAALRGEIEQALALLARPSLTDDSIHALRQGLKRARAALRLGRDAVPDVAYEKENKSLRDAARPLARARDSAALLELMEELLASRKLRRYRPVFVRVRAALRQSHARLLLAARGARTIGRMRRLLEGSLERTARWRLPRDARLVYRGGLRRIYRKGCEELHTALAQERPQALHEWRKQVKYLGAALAIATPGAARERKAMKVADEIARRLGDDHDLAMLTAALRRTAADRALKGKLEKKRQRLQKRAIKLARRLDEHCRPLLRY